MIDKEKIIMYSSNFFTKMARIYEKSIGRAFVGMFNHNQLTINFVETSFPFSDLNFTK